MVPLIKKKTQINEIFICFLVSPKSQYIVFQNLGTCDKVKNNRYSAWFTGALKLMLVLSAWLLRNNEEIKH